MNPLLERWSHPPFDKIRAEHFEPGVTEILADCEQQLSALEAEHEPTWQGLVRPIEEVSARIERLWALLGHLTAVNNLPEIRDAYEAVRPQLVTFALRFSQSAAIYKGFVALRDGTSWSTLDAAQQRAVECRIRDAKLSGVGLPIAEREQFNKFEAELSEISNQYKNNVLDAMAEWTLWIHDRADVENLPLALRERLAENARQHDEGKNATEADGPWCATLDPTVFQPFVDHCPNRELRQRIHTAFNTRASAAPYDNTPLLDRILELRKQQARLLGFETYAEYSLAAKMAPDVDTVLQTLEELRAPALAAARREIEDIAVLARAAGAPEGDDMRRWDARYWAERLREKKFDYSEEELRGYFPYDHVMNGIFGLFQRLFDVRVQESKSEIPVWHEDVRYYEVLDATGTQIAGFYVDPFSRPALKRTGAWHSLCQGRRKLGDGSTQLPISYVICNLTPPIGDRPSLLTLREVQTLLHEFGHGLQSMLTTVEHGMVAGLKNIEWDAIEIASQFMENWSYHPESLRSLSCHFETGEPLPDDLIERILATRTFHGGLRMVFQLHLASVDLHVHHSYDPRGPETPTDLEQRLSQSNTVLPSPPEDRYLCSFQHIFAGGYAAGYYSYKWAEVLSADAFSVFEEAGLDDPHTVATTGRRFRDTFLALGGSRDPMEVFVDFRGRAPSTEALLRHSGLAANPL